MLLMKGKSSNLSVNVPDEFIELLKQVAKSRGFSASAIFNEFSELMTEELLRMLD